MTGTSRSTSVILAVGLASVIAAIVLALHNPVIHDAAGNDGAPCLAPYDVVIFGSSREMPSGPYSDAKNNDLCHHAGVTHFYSAIGLLAAGTWCLGLSITRFRRAALA
jgi:hypothetical protein